MVLREDLVPTSSPPCDAGLKGHQERMVSMLRKEQRAGDNEEAWALIKIISAWARKLDCGEIKCRSFSLSKSLNFIDGLKLTTTLGQPKLPFKDDM